MSAAIITPELLTVAQLAALLGISGTSVRSLAHRAGVRCVRVNGAKTFDRVALLAAIAREANR